MSRICKRYWYQLLAASVTRSIVVAGILAQVAACASYRPPPSNSMEIDRPRIGRVVDADTGRPVDGAVVLLVFYLWPPRGFGNVPVSKVFRDSTETTTDRDGRFTLNGPFDQGSFWTEALYIYKLGYGPWRFRGQDGQLVAKSKEELESYWTWRREMWDQFATKGVVIELRPLRTREERIKYSDRGWAVEDDIGSGFSRTTPFGRLFFFDVPAERLANFQRLLDEERAKLGLPVRSLDGNRQPGPRSRVGGMT
jgi:hypothetical protein